MSGYVWTGPNFGCLRDQSARCQAHLKNFGCSYITGFASISSNRNRGSADSEELRPSKWYRCGRENPVSCRKSRFRGEEFESKWKLCKLKPICFSEYLKHIPDILEVRKNQSFGERQSSQSHARMTPRARNWIYTPTNDFCTCSSRSYQLNKTWTSYKPYNMVMSYWFYRIKFCSVGSPKKNSYVLINLLAIGLIHACEFLFVFVMHANFYLFLSVKKAAKLTRQTVTFIDFKDAVSKLVS